LGCIKRYEFALGSLRPPGLFTRKRRRGDRYVKRDIAAASEGDLDAEMVVARAIIRQCTGTFDPSAPSAARFPETGYFDLEPPFVAVEHGEKVAIALSGPLELNP
jgi:hypothetical protein